MPIVEIEYVPLTAPEMLTTLARYCTGCRWMLRGAWLAQELLTYNYCCFAKRALMNGYISTFESDIGTVSLVPSRVRPGGVFDIRLNGKTIWSRKVEGRFPEAKEIKQRVRDIISPEKNLGHSDSAEKKVVEAEFSKDETEKQMDDKTAEEQRRYFGVM
eukprot:768788-Hanusia_phi.AAC.3